MRGLRYLPPGHVVEVTCRTIQGRYLLLPGLALNQIVLGILGRAQRLYRVGIHAFVFTSNHYHLLLSPASVGELASFMGYLNGNLAKEAGRLHDWRDRLWSRRYQAIVVSHEEAAQRARLKYLLSHGCKEGFVGSPGEWPGLNCLEGLLKGQCFEGTWFDRSREYEARRSHRHSESHEFPETERVWLSPLPCWAELSPEDQRDRARGLVAEIEHEAVLAWGPQIRNRDRRSAQRALQQVGPHTRPDHLTKRPAPLFHAASSLARESLFAAYRTFVSAYRHAARQLRRAGPLAPFPEGCFPPALPFVPLSPD